MIEQTCRRCDNCQKNKRSKKKYGLLPLKQPEIIPWHTLCVDMIGPYKIERKRGQKNLVLWAVTMIDPAPGWFEIAEVPGTKRADVIANVVEQQWLCRYPWPQQVVMDRGTKFLAEFSKLLSEEYGIDKKPITKRNPQANSIVERVHQTIGNMLRTFSVQDNQGIDEKDPWSGILAAVAFAVRATVHTTTQASPSQLIFGRDAMINVRHIANWKYIEDRKKNRILINNNAENEKRLPLLE
jgi:hypothetical protein